MTALTILTTGEEATRACGAVLARYLQPQDVILLSGDLGAGKTALTKGVADGLGVGIPVTSPTFNILLVYEGRIPLYHFDLYRLEDFYQLEDIDYYAMLEADGVSVVEWGDRFCEATPQDGLSVSITISGDDDRCLTMQPIGPRGAALARSWVLGCEGLPSVRVGSES